MAGSSACVQGQLFSRFAPLWAEWGLSLFALHIRSPYCLPASRCWGRKGAGTFALWEVFLVQAICHPGLVISVTYFANSQFLDSEVTLSMI